MQLRTALSREVRLRYFTELRYFFRIYYYSSLLASCFLTIVFSQSQ